MKIKLTLLASFVVLVLAAGIGMSGEKKDQGSGIPDKYANMKNRFWDDPQAVAAGEKIYREKCSLCHGEEGDGKGPAAAVSSIQPADFTVKNMAASMGDGYWFWRVAKGGAFPPFNSIMPAFENQLTEEQIWQVVSYEHTFSHRGVHGHKELQEAKQHVHEREKGHGDKDEQEKGEMKYTN